jgi:hypothetical protein
MKTLLITIAILVSINLSGCAVPAIVKNITVEVLEGKARHLEQQESAEAFVNSYIVARNADNTALIERMTTAKFTPQNENRAHSIKLIGEPTVLAEENMAVVWASFTTINNLNDSPCGTSSFQLVKDNNDWKIANVTWSIEQIHCESNNI